MWSQEVEKVGAEKHPNSVDGHIQYGTAGFRTRGDVLDHVMYRMGALAALRSRAKNGATIGVMITASHNPEQDNGVKLVDPMGEMLEQSWEGLATRLANARDSDLGRVLQEIAQEQKIDVNSKASVFVGRDTRKSSPGLARAVLDGVSAAGGQAEDFGVVSTPMLHYNVVCKNTGGKYGEVGRDGYFRKLAGAFKAVRGPQASAGKYTPVLKYDGANGVGADAMRGLAAHLGSGVLDVEVLNDGAGDGDVLNFGCGADFVKVQQKAPRGFEQTRGQRCVSVDGDADRVIFFFNDDAGQFHMLDGDKIATLVAGYLKELITGAGLELNLGLVQTAYANGSSTKYISEKLNVPVKCAATGVKHLHHEAVTSFDVGVYFEANGHGTVVFAPAAEDKVRAAATAAGADSPAAKLAAVIDIINQTVGDAISDMLLVETILHARGWSAQDWSSAYADLPNRQLKVRVADRGAISTADAERRAVTPAGLQEEIDRLVVARPEGRSFVRPSGTEDVVRVYAEASTREDADALAEEVGAAVHRMAGGVGDPPKL